MLVFHKSELPEGVIPPYSYRSRAIIPSENINDSKVTSDLTTVNQNDVVVLGKKHKLEDAIFLSEKGIKFIVDVADHKFGLFKHWFQTIPMANAVTSTCDYLAQTTKNMTGIKDVFIIPDPTERPKKIHHVDYGKKVKLFYYGAESNFSKIDWWLIRHALRKVTDVEIRYMMNKSETAPKGQKFRKLHQNWMYYKELDKVEDEGLAMWRNVIPWTYEGQQELLQWCDMVILPVVSDEESRCKGNNRPVDALQSGRFVLSNHGIPSYGNLKEHIWLGNLSEGLEWALQNKYKVADKITLGQMLIEHEYSPKAIANKWEKLYENLNSK